MAKQTIWRKVKRKRRIKNNIKFVACSIKTSSNEIHEKFQEHACLKIKKTFKVINENICRIGSIMQLQFHKMVCHKKMLGRMFQKRDLCPFCQNLKNLNVDKFVPTIAWWNKIDMVVTFSMMFTGFGLTFFNATAHRLSIVGINWLFF